MRPRQYGSSKQALDAVTDVTGVDEKFTEVVFDGADRQKTEFYEDGTKASQLYDSAVGNYFLKTFGRNDREIVCECERSNEPSMVQVLHLSNGSTLNDKLAAETGRLRTMVAGGKSDGQIVRSLYGRALSREPTAEELAGIHAALAEPDADRNAVLEDVAWAVLSSREFLFNH